MRHNSCNTIEEPVRRLRQKRICVFISPFSMNTPLGQKFRVQSLSNAWTWLLGLEKRENVMRCSEPSLSNCCAYCRVKCCCYVVLQIFAGGLQIPARNADFDVSEARRRQNHVHKQRPILRNNFRLYSRPWQTAQITDSKGKIRFICLLNTISGTGANTHFPRVH